MRGALIHVFAAEIARLARAPGKASNYKRPIIFVGFIWVLLWYLFDPNRTKLLTVFRRLFPVFWKYPGAADAALQRLISYRHVCRFVNMLDRHYASTPSARPTSASRVGHEPEGVPA